MTRLSLIALLTLTACAPFQDCPRENIICDPATKRCVCNRPTASLPAIERERGDTPRPEVTPHEPHGPEHPGPEPRREDDPVAHDAWEDRYDAWKEAGGIWP